MPEQDDDQLIFAADIDANLFNNKLDAMSAKLEAAREEAKLIKQEMRDFENALKKNEKEIDKIDQQINKLDKSSRTYRADLQALNKEADELRKKNIALSGGLEGATKAFKIADEQVKGYSKSVTQLTKQKEQVNAQIRRFTDVNQFSARVVSGLSERVFGLVTTVVAGFAGGLVANVIPAMAEWIERLIEGSDSVLTLKKQKEILNEVFMQAAKNAGEETAKLEVYRIKLNDTNIPAAERVKIAKEYNKTADETAKIDLQQINNLELINQQIEKQIKLIQARAISNAALSKLGEAATKFLEKELPFRELQVKSGLSPEAFDKELELFIKRSNEVEQQIIKEGDRRQSDFKQRRRFDPINASIQPLLDRLGISQPDLIRIRQFRNQAKEEFDAFNALLAPLIEPDGLTTNKKGPAQPKAVENIFQQKLAELRARLAAALSRDFQSETLIREKFEEQLDKEVLQIGEYVKDKKLTPAQAQVLKNILKQITEVDLNRELGEFRKRVAEVLRQIDEAITQANQEAETQRIANLRNDLERQEQQINNSYNAIIASLTKRRDDLIRKIDEDLSKGLISETDAANRKNLITQAYEALFGQAAVNRNNQFEDLLFNRFEDNIAQITEGFNQFELKNEQRAAERIAKEKSRFAAGEISFKKFQKNITKILADAAQERDALRLRELVKQRKAAEEQLSATNDPEQRRKIQEQVTGIDTEIAKINQKTPDKPDEGIQKRVEQISQYAAAIGNIVDQVVKFWQSANAAEQAALDRSIRLQERRVEAAARIAERGNAEYLQLEEERLRELELKRENSARRQLAINAVLQTSQALVAFTSALAQGIATGGPLGGIAIAAAVLGLLASGYAIVKSLDQPQSFYKGTESVQRKGAPAGRDTIPAMLNEGEAVIPTDTNKEYSPAVKAIYNRRIPAEVLNEFVKNYRGGAAANVNYQLVGEAAGDSISANGKMYQVLIEQNQKLDEQNHTLNRMNKQLHKLGVNVTLDKHGFSLSMVEAARQIEIDKKS